MPSRSSPSRRWLTHSPGVDSDFSVVRYLLHLARSNAVPTRHAASRPKLEVGRDEIGVTFIGHSTVLLELAGVRILTDPVLSQRVLVAKRLVSPGLPQGGLPDLDVVLVSHGHHDHLDVPTHRRLRKQNTIALVAKNLGDLLTRAGYARVVELDWGETFEHKGVRFTALGVNHWGTRGVLPDRRGYCGFLLESDTGTVFFPGDTAYTPLFREYGERFAIDIALLPIGAYRPASFRRVHMNPQDALQAFADLRARYFVPIHWGTFVLSYEPPEEPLRWTRELACEAGVEEGLAVLEHGEGRTFRVAGRSAGG